MKKYLSLLVFSLVFIPVVASAAWWNPFSWFSKKEPVILETAIPVADVLQEVPQVDTTLAEELQAELVSLKEENAKLRARPLMKVETQS